MKNFSVDFDQVDKETILKNPEILRPILSAVSVFGKYKGLEVDDAIEEIVDRVSYASADSGNMRLKIYSKNPIKWFRFTYRLVRQKWNVRFDKLNNRFVVSRA